MAAKKKTTKTAKSVKSLPSKLTAAQMAKVKGGRMAKDNCAATEDTGVMGCPG